MHALDGPARRDRLGDNTFLRCRLIPKTDVWFGKCLIPAVSAPVPCFIWCGRGERSLPVATLLHWAKVGQKAILGFAFYSWVLPAGETWIGNGAMAEMSRAGLGRMSVLHTAGLQKQISHRGIFNTLRDGIEARHPTGWMACEAAAAFVQGGQGKPNSPCVRWPRQTLSWDLGRTWVSV